MRPRATALGGSNLLFFSDFTGKRGKSRIPAQTICRRHAANGISVNGTEHPPALLASPLHPNGKEAGGRESHGVFYVLALGRV